MLKKIALVVSSLKNSGGAYQEAMYAISNIEKNNNKKFEFIIVTDSKTLKNDIETDFEIIHFKLSFIQKFICYLRSSRFFIDFFNKFFFRNSLESFFKKNNIDFLYFLDGGFNVKYIEDMNFIMNIPDLCHRVNLEFPEVRNSFEFEKRENLYKKYLPKAFSIITNSEIIKNQIIKYYSVDEDRICVIPHQPSNSVLNFKEKVFDEKIKDIIFEKFNLPEQYIFYPAQFWPHKNHIYIIKSIKILNEKFNKNIKAVFTGSEKINFKKLKSYVERNNLNSDIKFLNFVSDNELPYLYKECLAVVMPSFFGPTNIPPLEGFCLDVPVIYSDLKDFRKEFGESVYYVDLNEPESLSKAILNISEDNSLKQKLILAGREKLKTLSLSENFNQIFKLLDKYSELSKSWTIR
tara:strand:- start:193 stop:1410 length:1218 start_codon:yes stop_codon:yes gene_type:complete